MSVFATPYRSADVTFVQEPHSYWLPNGRNVPSVTEILLATRVSTDFEALAAFSDRRAAQIERKRDIGTAVHADAHAFDDDDLDWSTVHPEVLPYLRAWAAWRENTGATPLTRERLVYHSALGYCGTLDGIFQVDVRRVLVDIKVGDPEDAGAAYQTAAYELAWMTEHETPTIDERWAVRLCQDLDPPYRITKYPDWRDVGKWRAIVTTYYCQAERRR